MATSEQQIFDMMWQSFGLAIDACEKLSVMSRKGLPYEQLRTNLHLIEGCCRQAAVWRGGDARYLPIGVFMANCHNRAGDWLRGHKDPITGYPIALPLGVKNRNFVELASYLRWAENRCREFQEQKTGRTGVILPQSITAAAPRRIGAPVQGHRLIMPPNAAKTA